MQQCHQCKGKGKTKSAFGGKEVLCHSCKDPKTGLSTGMIMDPLVTCPVCNGGGYFKSMGGMERVSCIYCGTLGNVNQSKIKADAEQDKIQRAKDAERKTDVDKRETNSNQREWSTKRKESAVGSSAKNL